MAQWCGSVTDYMQPSSERPLRDMPIASPFQPNLSHPYVLLQRNTEAAESSIQRCAFVSTLMRQKGCVVTASTWCPSRAYRVHPVRHRLVLRSK